jgi:dTDP-4-amino-4,6-dideoxygalactose transaminase
MEIQAAVGSNQIDSIEKFVNKRREIAIRVTASLKGSNLEVIGAETLVLDPRAHSWMLIPIMVTGEQASRRKQLILQELEKLEIETRPVLTGNFLAQPAIQRITRHAVDPSQFVNANKVTNEAFMVGAHHDLTEVQINFLCQSLSEVGKL